MLEKIMTKLMNVMLDDVIKKTLTEKYPENLFVLATAATKLGPQNIVEATMRAQSGKALSRPYGAINHLSHWNEILLNPRQLFQLPTPDNVSIDTTTVIGPKAKRPLTIHIPIMITGMSYGGSLSLKAKMALAKGASMMGTATNTGESAVTNEERDSAKFLIGQYNRGGWLNTHDQLKRLDAIEVQLGQGAYGGAVPSPVYCYQMDEHLRNAWGIKEGEDTGLKARLPGIDSPEAIKNLMKSLKEQYEVPVGIKIAATHFLERELDVMIDSGVDFITLDGAEGGTAVAPPTLEDSMGLPTLYALGRAVRYLEKKGVKKDISLIIAGGLRNPGEFLKALALGADGVYIGSIAVIAMLQSQAAKTMPEDPPTQIPLYEGKDWELLDVEEGSVKLANFLASCIEEMKLATIATGKSALKDLNKEDLVTVNKNYAQLLGIDYAGDPIL